MPSKIISDIGATGVRGFSIQLNEMNDRIQKTDIMIVIFKGFLLFSVMLLFPYMKYSYCAVNIPTE
jgi:hypothetical protein